MSDVKDQLLKKLGFKLEDLEAEDFDLKDTVSKFEDSQKEKFQKLFKNDTEYKEQIETATEKRIYKALDGVFGKYLDKEEMEQAKHAREKVTKLAEKLAEGSNKDVEDLQKEVHTLKDQLTEKDSEIEKVKETEHARADSRIIQSMFKDKFGAFSDDRLIGSRDTAFKLLHLDMSDKYDFKLEDSEIKIYDKGTEKLAEKDNSFLSVDDLITDTLESNKLLKQSTGGGSTEEKSGSAGSKTDEGDGVRTSPKTNEKFDFVSDNMKRLNEKIGVPAQQ